MKNRHPATAASDLMNGKRPSEVPRDEPSSADSLVTPDPIGNGVDGTARPSNDEPLPAEQTPVRPLRVARRLASDGFERDYLVKLLAIAGGSVSRAAELADVSRQRLTKMLHKHGVRGGKPRRSNV